LRNELKSLQRRLGITTLMVTHDQAEALAIADRIAVMRAGRLLQVGSPKEIYISPVDPFTGEFVGAMNLLPATIENQGSVRILGKMTLNLEHGFAAGTPALAAVRPEFIQIFPASDALAPDTLDAVIQRREFQGAFVRLSLSVGGFDRPLLADVGSASGFADEGERVALRIPPEHLRLFATSSVQ
jgi:iron(III) transport system ATP-binding protein